MNNAKQTATARRSGGAPPKTAQTEAMPIAEKKNKQTRPTLREYFRTRNTLA